MNPERKVDASKIQILDIKTLQGQITSEENVDTALLGGQSFEFNVTTGLNPDENIIGLKLKVDIQATDVEGNPIRISGSYTHEVVFSVENLSDFIEVKDVNGVNEYVVDVVLGATLAGIIYSTVRGIIFTRTQGTSLGAVVLPVIDPLRLIQENQSPEANNHHKTAP
ncbi:MAG: hypothetical protein HYU71_10825 [Bacteroidetes bacterium]|nr:hypothetical protein [Bacteroidota bacterium]